MSVHPSISSVCPSVRPSVCPSLRGLSQPLRGPAWGGTCGCTDGRTDVQIPPVFYRTLSPLVPSGAAAQKASASILLSILVNIYPLSGPRDKIHLACYRHKQCSIGAGTCQLSFDIFLTWEDINSFG